MICKRSYGLVPVALTLALVVGCSNSHPATPSTEPAGPTQVVEEHWPNGRLKVRKELIASSKGGSVDHGTYERWYDNGQKEYEATFVHGQKDGPVTRWHKNGQKWVEEHYVAGQRHGVRSIWNDKGMKAKEEHYLHGKPHGTWMSWNSKGKVRSRQVFDEDTSEQE